MKRVLDAARAVVLSPEIVGVLLPFVLYAYAPGLADVLAKPMKDSFVFSLAVIALPIGMLAFNYKESLELLSPTDAGKVLLEWSDYPMLKMRVIVALSWCVAAAGAGLVAVWMVAIDSRVQLAVAILASAVLAAATATGTIGLARFRVREILGAQ